MNNLSTHDVLRERLLKKAGLLELPPARYKLSDLESSEWSPEFEQLMRNRLIMGALRYGPIGVQGKPRYDRIGSITKRLLMFRLTGNKELLVDCANLLLLEFVECHHPLAHFASVDDTTEHVKRVL